jgi:hypothetical protein
MLCRWHSDVLCFAQSEVMFAPKNTCEPYVFVKKKVPGRGTKRVLLFCFCGVDGSNQHTADGAAVMQIYINDFLWEQFGLLH